MLSYFVCPYIANIYCWWFCTLYICKGDIVCRLYAGNYNTLCIMCILIPMSDCFYWFKFVCDCTLHFVVITFFFQRSTYIHWYYQPHSQAPASFVAALQASLVETSEWDYKHFVYLWTILGQSMCGFSTVSLQDEEIVGAFQIIGVFYHIWTMTEPFRLWNGLM